MINKKRNMITRKELQQICKKRKVPGWYRMNKAELGKAVTKIKSNTYKRKKYFMKCVKCKEYGVVKRIKLNEYHEEPWYECIVCGEEFDIE